MTTASQGGSAAPTALPKVSHLDRHGYLFGHKLEASLSPLFHNTIYRELGFKWEQLRLDSSDIPQFLSLIQDPKFYGASVTMPNKVAIMEHLDEATEECREVGACNTIFVRERDRDRDRDRYDGGQPQRIYCGANTDVIGVREAFYQNVADPDAVFHDRPAMVVGGGGAARSAVYALRKWMRATKIYLVNRDGAEVRAVMADCTARGYGGDALVHLETVDQATQAEVLPGAIVACVPDLPPNTEGERTARAIVETVLRKDRNGCMLEMCYNPSPWTELGGIAEQEGWQVILGTEAMVWQGLEQDRYWTGMETKTLPVQKVRDVISEKLASIRETL